MVMGTRVISFSDCHCCKLTKEVSGDGRMSSIDRHEEPHHINN